MEPQITKDMLFSGTQVAYFVICPAKLWLFSHNVRMEQSSDLVKSGKIIHETSYQQKKKEIMIDSKIAIDFVKRGDELILHEIKKSSRLEKAHKCQLLYYMYYLNKEKGISCTGEIDYPLERRKLELSLSEGAVKEIESILTGISQILSLPKPPAPEKKRYCRKCSYFQFCWC